MCVIVSHTDVFELWDMEFVADVWTFVNVSLVPRVDEPGQSESAHCFLYILIRFWFVLKYLN